MSALTLADAKAHLNVTFDTDDTLISAKIEAAEAWIAQWTGDFTTTFPNGVPEPILEATRQLTAGWYENREAAIDGQHAYVVPFGVSDLIAPYRQWAF